MKREDGLTVLSFLCIMLYFRLYTKFGIDPQGVAIYVIRRLFLILKSYLSKGNISILLFITTVSSSNHLICTVFSL